MSRVSGVAAGRLHCLALQTNGTVVGWGYNAFGQASPPANLSNVVAIAAGYLHSVALLANGTVVAWGDNTYGQTAVPIGLTNVAAISAGDFDTLALRRDGSIVAWGDDSYGQLNIPLSLRGAVGIASGNYHGLAMIPITASLRAQMTSAGLVVQWLGSGQLQWAASPRGPFTNMLTQGNCLTNSDMSAPAKFFRVVY
jgi:alpha-tubulin suppressor-like RCC1 family protein